MGAMQTVSNTKRCFNGVAVLAERIEHAEEGRAGVAAPEACMCQYPAASSGPCTEEEDEGKPAIMHGALAVLCRAVDPLARLL